SGITVPAIVQEIAQGNEKGVQPWINLQGYLLGNAVTTEKETNYKIPFAHGMGLISDELYEIPEMFYVLEISVHSTRLHQDLIQHIF
ncbi:serine carboxypeptidase, partial [Trifolium medium]|nr:serine carboxypeptidase [Trifolium medium]